MSVINEFLIFILNFQTKLLHHQFTASHRNLLSLTSTNGGAVRYAN